MLTLPIKKKWFDMIESGEKKEEYREYNQYYKSRFDNLFAKTKCGNVRFIRFRNGYRKDSPTIECRVTLGHGLGRPEWGAIEDKWYYVLTIISVKRLEIEND